MIANRQFILSIIKEVNPLWLPKPDGTGYVFASKVDCYVYFMEKCHEVAPKGYMDLLVLLVGLYGWTFSQAIRFYKTYAEERMGERITLLKIGDLKSKAFYRKFITCLHDYFNTDFELQAFSNAWDIHKDHVLSNQLNVKDYAKSIETKTKGDTQQ